jgi:hypothetical protein
VVRLVAAVALAASLIAFAIGIASLAWGWWLTNDLLTYGDLPYDHGAGHMVAGAVLAGFGVVGLAVMGRSSAAV